MSTDQPPKTYYTNTRYDVLEHIRVPELGNILEIGGGEFPTLKSLSEKVYGEYWGIDIINPKDPPKHFFLGSIEDPSIAEKIPTDHFDIVLMNDVLEHIWDTEKILKVVYDSLRVGGQICISVPNVRQIRFAMTILAKGSFPREPSGMFDSTHRRWFTKRDIVDVVKLTGFKVCTAVNKGRLVPKNFRQSILGELLGLHTIVVAEKYR